jgi:hypothetical protein
LIRASSTTEAGAMATTFTITIDLADHEHPGADWRAQHHTVVTLLDRVKQSVGSSPGRRGDIVHTGFANGQSSSTTIGTWEFRNDETVDRSRKRLATEHRSPHVDDAAGPASSLGDPAI